MYISQSMLVRWQGIKSEAFNCSNGVKQGGVLSPVLFCVYMDALLNALQECHVGCHINNEYAGALSYADDLTLLAPSFAAMREMLKVCELFSREYDVLFNGTKSVSLLFNCPVVNPLDLSLNGEVIPCKPSAVHLGNFIGQDAEQCNRKKAMSDLYARSNYVRNTYKFRRISEKCFLFNTFCTSFYGSSLLDICASESLFTCWRKCIRSLLGLNPRTHSALIPHLIGKVDLKIDLLARFFRFLLTCVSSRSGVVRTCMQTCMSSNTAVSRNIKFFMYYMNLNVEMLNDLCEDYGAVIKKKRLENCEPQTVANSTAIVELLRLRNSEMEIFLDRDQVSTLLHELCIN
eukprot:GHVO01042902.1.p1 GENE.GHVO01042902.1~~GHVO01042902.1.p1  ORF type:complete len:346 (+),score=-14.08 GHVO01042902.1:235-1272(+)